MEGLYQVGDVMPTNVRINDALRALPMFRCKDSLKDYQVDNNIPLSLHPFRVVNHIVRPLIESLILTQTSKPGWKF